MINFDYLDRLMQSARRPALGKPLDKHRGIGRIAWGGNMRNCRLFKHSDDEYRIELHRHRIATIRRLGNAALITIDSVESWPTPTTADRLSGIFYTPVYKRDNQLRMTRFVNMTGAAPVIPPLADGMRFVQTTNGLYCVDPDKMIDHSKRYVGDKDAAKQVKQWLNKVKKHLMVQVKLGILPWSEIYDAMQEGHGRSKLPEVGSEINQELIRDLTAWYGYTQGGWRVQRWAQNSVSLGEHDVKSLLNKVKDNMYHSMSIYRRDKIDFTQYFSPVNINAFTGD
jgi:hypothetical protein